MKFTAAMVFIGLGYTVAYYGASMWKRVAAPAGSNSGDGIPFRVLVFGINAIDFSKPNTVPPQTLPPFQASPSTSTSANPTGSSTPPKVQSV